MEHMIVHVEIPADNVQRGKEFYAQLFDWQFANAPDYEDYWMANLGEGTSQGVALMARQSPGQMVTNYIGVDSVAEYVARVEQLGGKVAMPRSPVPGMGWFAICQDTEGNMFGLWQNDPSAA
jgi:hypothetical protein